MQLAMVGAAKRNHKFVAGFAAECSRLHEPQMMRVGGFSVAEHTGLLGDKSKVLVVAIVARFASETGLHKSPQSGSVYRAVHSEARAPLRHPGECRSIVSTELLEAATGLPRHCRYRAANCSAGARIIKCIKAQQVIHVPFRQSPLQQRFAGILGRDVHISNRLGQDSGELFGRIRKGQSLRSRDQIGLVLVGNAFLSIPTSAGVKVSALLRSATAISAPWASLGSFRSIAHQGANW
jgi:hypothetical protein